MARFLHHPYLILCVFYHITLVLPFGAKGGSSYYDSGLNKDLNDGNLKRNLLQCITLVTLYFDKYVPDSM